MVADDHVAVPVVAEPMQSGPGVVEHRPVPRVDVHVAHVGSGPTGGRLVGAGDDVRAAQSGVEIPPPHLGRVELWMGCLGPVPREAVPESLAQSLLGDAVIGGDPVEGRQQGRSPVAVAGDQRAVEVPQHRGAARRRRSCGGRAVMVVGSHHLDPPGRKGAGSCGSACCHGGRQSIHAGSKAP